MISDIRNLSKKSRCLVMIFVVSVFCFLLTLSFSDRLQLGPILVQQDQDDNKMSFGAHAASKHREKIKKRMQTHQTHHSRTMKVLRYYARKCSQTYMTKNTFESSFKRSRRGPVPWNVSQFSAVSKDFQEVLDLPIPNEFHPDFLNPCWYSSEKHTGGSLRCLPYFFLAGFPKCGTTDLYLKIALHPQIQLANVKEPHWWDRRRFTDALCKGVVNCTRPEMTSFKTYVSMYNTSCLERLATMNVSKPIQFVTGDGSASTFWDNRLWSYMPGNQDTDQPRTIIAQHIHHYLPDSKIIVIVRNPVERMFSDFLYFWKNGTPTAAKFHEKITLAVDKMQTCLANHTTRACAYSRDDLIIKSRLPIGMYSVYAKDWLSIFNRSQIHFLRTEDYKEQPLKELNKIYSFLGLGTFPESASHLVENLPSTNKRRNSRRDIEMLPATRQLLADFYKPFTQELAHILDDKSFLWKSDYKNT